MTTNTTSTNFVTNATPCSCCGQYTWSTNNAFITVASPTYQEKIEMIKALGEMFFNQMSDELKALIERKITDTLATI